MDNTSSSLTDSPRNPLAEVTLEQLPVNLQKAAARAGWTSLVAVQGRAIPYLLAGRNMMIQARTGSGKTGAFLLPLLERLDPARRPGLDDGARRRPADALGAAEGGQAAVAADDRDRGAVRDALGEAGRQIADVDEARVEERLGRHAEGDVRGAGAGAEGHRAGDDETSNLKTEARRSDPHGRYFPMIGNSRPEKFQ